MYRLSCPLVEFYCLTGEPINVPLEKAVRSIKVSEQAFDKQRDRMNSFFKGERLDHIPISADLRWWFAERYNNGTLEEDLKGCDLNKIIPCSLGSTSFTMPPKVEPLPNVIVEEIWEGNPIQYVNGGFPGSIRKLKISTPAGCLTAEEAYASRSFGIQEYPLKTIEDLKVVKYIYEKRAQYSTKELPIKSWCAPMTPIQILNVQLAGITNTAYLLADYQEEMEDFMCFLEEIHRPVITYLAPTSKIMFSVENLTSEVSGGYFDKYLGPQLLSRSKIVEKYGAAIGVHHDGKLHPLFSRLKEVGVKYTNGITATASELEGLREAAGNEMILVDIIPQHIFMSNFRQEDFEKFIRHAAEIFKHDNRVIFGIGDMLPCNGDIHRFETMIDIITECTGK